MPPKQKSKKLATTGEARKTRTHTRCRGETNAKRHKQHNPTGEAPSRPFIVDSDSEDETSTKSMSVGEAAETLLFYSNQEQPHISTLDPSSHTTESTWMNVGGGEHTVTPSEIPSAHDELDITPPLPKMSVTIADLAKNNSLDPFNRKEVCQYNQRKLEEEFVGFWNPKQRPFSDRFISEHASNRYFSLRKRTIIEEKVVSSVFPPNRDVLDLIKNAGFSETVENLDPYCREIVLEFYANFTGLSKGTSRVNFVFVRGRMYEFSPRMINLVLGLENYDFATKSELNVALSETQLISEMTGGQISQWADFKAIWLLPVLNLHGICSLNWLPTSNSTHVSQDRARLLYKVWKKKPFNLGKVIFDQVAAIVASPLSDPHVKKKTLPFPYIISKVLEFQKEVPHWPKEMPESGPKDYRVDIRASKIKAGKKNLKSCPNCNHVAAEVHAIIKIMTKLAEKLQGM